MAGLAATLGINLEGGRLGDAEAAVLAEEGGSERHTYGVARAV